MIDPWTLKFHRFNPEEIGVREALCVLGNGYFSTRGAAEEVHDDTLNYPGTYLAGGFNRLKSKIEGQEIWNEDLVNLPNWLSICFYPSDSDETWLNWQSASDLEYELTLDMKKGLLIRTTQFSDHKGRKTKIYSKRIVSMANPHLAAIKYSILPLNWEGDITVVSSIDGFIKNNGVERYQAFNSQHLKILDMEQIAVDTIMLTAVTTQSHFEVVEAVRTKLFMEGQELLLPAVTTMDEQTIKQNYSLRLVRGQPLVIEKTVGLFSSKDFASRGAFVEAKTVLDQAPDFKIQETEHVSAWKQLWQCCDVKWSVPDTEKQLLYFNIFHLLQTISPHSVHLDYGAPARGLHGEAYRGHVFWDELFIFPFFTRFFPEITRSLLLYRYRRLKAAKRYAASLGYQGAMYPWQSASDGEEVSQVLHLNPQSNAWGPDFSSLQRHVSAAIAYNIWSYYQATKDELFLCAYGAEMLLEIARFWASIATFNEQKQRYEICGVMGPDEFHEAYPNARTPGLNNNAYTNVMAVWTIERAIDILYILPSKQSKALKQKLKLDARVLKQWKEISHNMFVPFHEGVISQFEGYETLQAFPLEAYRNKYGNIERLDRILKKEGDSPNCYQIAKQADTVMLFYLFQEAELQALFHQLGYSLPTDTIKATIHYYLERTSHGSTLSKIVFASILAEQDPLLARELYLQTLHFDIDDLQGTTREGIHLGAMAATVMYALSQ